MLRDVTPDPFDMEELAVQRVWRGVVRTALPSSDFLLSEPRQHQAEGGGERPEIEKRLQKANLVLGYLCDARKLPSGKVLYPSLLS